MGQKRSMRPRFVSKGGSAADKISSWEPEWGGEGSLRGARGSGGPDKGVHSFV